MRTNRFISVFIFSASIISMICQSGYAQLKPLDYVDMHIGTAKKGHTMISPTRPFAMVKPGPDTELIRNYLHSKYITGFSQLHMSGTGGSAQSAILGIMPTTGKLSVDPNQYRSGFIPTKDKAEPGYYSVMLEDYNINTEMTSTDRVSMYRFVFPESDESHILLNVSHAFIKYRGGEIRIVNNTTIEGVGYYNGYHGSDFDVAFTIEFSKPFKTSGVWKGTEILKGEDYAFQKEDPALKGQAFFKSDKDNYKFSNQEIDQELGAYVDFQTEKDEPIYVKIAMSYVDLDGARKNMKKELPGWNFEKVVNESQKIWNDQLKKVKVTGGTEDQKTAFYTALYHTMISTSMLSDVDNRYEGFDGKIHKAKGFTYYGELSLWDTYRTTHPLFSLLEPKRQSDIVKSLLKMAEQGGWLPKWAWSEGYSGGMLGDHAVTVILDSYVKGIRDFDVNKAYAAMRKNATEKLEGVPWGRRGLKHYMNLGFAPEDAGFQKAIDPRSNYRPGGWITSEYYHEISGSVSATLEFSYDDWCVAEMAKLIGNSEDAGYFGKRAYNYKNVYDPYVGFMRPRNSDGTWAMNPFNPIISAEHSQFYCEGNAWTYSWTVQHDVQGLINLMGGNKTFLTKLDSLFSGLESGDAYFDPTNEPDIHYPYLYNYAGAPWKTQKIVRYLTQNTYSADHEHGLPGDDDAGTMSAWYIFSSLGFYPVAPGSQEYIIGSPLFDKVEIALDENYFGKNIFTVESINNNANNIYIQKATLNGESMNKTWITHNEIIESGHLVFTMGDTPNKEWGVDESSIPSSMTKEEPNFVYSNLKAPKTCTANDYIDVSVMVTNTGGMGTAQTILYHLDQDYSIRHFKRSSRIDGKKKTVLQSGESKEIHFTIPIYYRGANTLQVDNLTTDIQVAWELQEELRDRDKK